MEYSAFVLDVERPIGTHLLATCRELGVTFVAYSPLGRGLLTEAFSKNETSTDKADLRSAFFPRFQEANRAANVKLVSEFKALADKKGCTTSQLAIAWLVKQGGVIPIPGTRKLQYLEMNWEALQFQLTDEEEADIRRFVEGAEMSGGRGPPNVHPIGVVDTKEEA